MKKIISTAMAAVMMLSMVSPFGARFYAEDLPQATAVEATGETAATLAEEQEPAQNNAPAVSTNETAGEDSAVEKVAELFAALPKAEDVLAMSEEERQAIMAMMTEAINAYDALSAEEGAAFLAKYGALYDAVTGDLMAALLSAGGNDTSDLSLQPMEETKDVYLTLFGYSADQLKNFPVDDLLDMLTDAEGNPIEVEKDGYTGAWIYYEYGDDYKTDRDEYYTLGNGETVDLWDYYTWGDDILTTTYTLWIVLGNGTQLDDSKNHRYIVTVDISTYTDIFGSFSFELKSDSNSYISAYGGKAYGSNYGGNANYKEVFDALGMQGDVYDYYVYGQNAKDTYKLTFSDYDVNKVLREGAKTEIYPIANFLAYRDEGAELTGEITDQLLTDGYSNAFDTVLTTSNYKQADNLFAFVFKDLTDGHIIGYLAMAVHVKKISDAMPAEVFAYENGQQVSLYKADWKSSAYNLFEFNLKTEQTEDGAIIDGRGWRNFISFELPDGYPVDEAYYLTLPDNGLIKSVYKGVFIDEAEAVNYGEDITDQVLCDGSETAPYGYQTVFKDAYFTLIFSDGEVIVLDFYARRPGDGSYYGNRIDPYFEIKDVEYPQKYLSRYIARDVSGLQLDTYYRTDDKYDVGGYQLVLIKEELTQEELRELVPSFSTPEGCIVSSGVRMISGETNLENAQWSDSIADTVAYQVSVPGVGVKNYQVTFKTLQENGTLFVAGPDERFVNLTEDNDYIHDILVANIGKEDLTGINVELINPVNIKLDPYWTMNDSTLSGFKWTSPGYETTDEGGGTHWESNTYATPDNIGKIRLLADGEGEISGTLRITTADGQKRDIKLTGIAANPHIISTQLAEAVKYVPYSYMVATNNMYKWNRASFKIISGRLPDGMQFYESTGEIYGTPTETGDFTFTVQVDYSSSRFSSSQATLTLHVADNTNKAVYMQSDEGYSIKVPLGVEQGEGTYDFYLADTSTDQLYVSNGTYNEFIDVWLNGQRLIPGVDYTSESGSTRITIRSQTFATKAYTDRYNTIAAEFRVDGDNTKELKRTAQNFRLSEDMLNENGSSGSNSGSGSNANQSSGSSSGTQTTVNTVDLGQAPENAAGVTLRFYVVDGNGSPVVGATAELHSTPRYGTTDGAGCVVFSNVEFGSHTLTIYDANGNVMGGKSFVLAHGGFGVDGSVITVSDGALVDITVKAENGTLQFANTTLAQGSAAIPQTGDDFEPRLWLLLAVLSACMATGMTIYKKKKDQM